MIAFPRSKYVTEEEKELWNKVNWECMSDKEKYSDSEREDKRKIKYLKLDWRSADLEELIESIDNRQNIKRTYKNIGGRIHPGL